MDDLDRIKEQEEFFRNMTISQIRDQVAMKQESALFCEECDEPIPQGRREAEPGCRLCVACKSMEERGL